MIFSLILKTLVFLLVTFLLVTFVREIISYTSLTYLREQGLKTLYFPIVGMLWLMRLKKGSNDQVAELRKLIKEFKDEKAFAINQTSETNPIVVLLDDELIREFFVKEIDHTNKWLPVVNINRGFSLHNGERAFESRSIYSKFFNHENLVSISTRASRSIERAIKDFELSQFKDSPTAEVLGKSFITKCMSYLMNCVVLGEDENSFDPKSDLSDQIVDYTCNMFRLCNSLKNIATWGVLHKYNIFSESKALWNQLQHLEKEIYSRYLRRLASKPSLEPNIIDSIVEFNKAKREANGKELDEKEIAGHWMLIQSAGIDTTMHLMVNGLHVLAHNQKLQDKVRQAVLDQIASKKGEEFTYTDYMENDVVDRFANELIRIRGPSILLNPRRAFKDFSIGKIKIRSGTSIIVPLNVNMNTERFYEQPDTFNIDRLPRDAIKKVKKAGFMPFGQGRRACPGKVLGELMTRILISQILRRYIVEPSPESDDTKVFLITYGCRNPQFILRKREESK